MSDCGGDVHDDSDVDHEWDEANWYKTVHGPHERPLWAPRFRAEWQFLRDWFQRTRDRCHFSDPDRDNTHPVRVGREVHDWWTDVYLETGDLDKRSAPLTQRAARYRSIGEAVRIMAAMARVDYKSWLGEFIRATNYEVPTFMKLQVSEELPRQFSFFFAFDLDPACYQWQLLQTAFGVDYRTEVYKTHMAQILEVVKTFKKKEAPVNWKEKVMDPVPMKLKIAPDETSLPNQIKILTGITQTIVKLQEIEAEWRAAPADSDIRSRPVFHIECVDLNLREFSLHPNVLRTIRKLIETGVRIHHLTLPEGAVQSVDEAKLRLGWGLFLSTALGHRPLPNGAHALIDKLVVPSVYAFESTMLPFLSAVATTMSLTEVRMEMNEATRSDQAAQVRIWEWIGYSFFSAASTNSVKTLWLDAFKLDTSSLGAGNLIANSEDPLGRLWVSTSNLAEDPFLVSKLRQLVTVKKEARIIALGFLAAVPDVHSAFSYQAVVVRDESCSSSVDVLIPGFGFCRIDRSFITSHPGAVARALPPRALENLVVGNKQPSFVGVEAAAIPTKAFIARLLELAGPNLTGLALEADDLDKFCLGEVDLLCPRLIDFRLRGATLPSMEPVTQLWDENPQCRIGSLDLRDLKVPISSFEKFLVRLSSDGEDGLVRTLRRLRVGRGWSSTFRHSTDDLIEPFLCSNRHLTHFHLYARPQHINIGWDIDDYNFGGEMVPDISLPAPTRLGLLSVLRHRSTTNKDACELTPELVNHIFSFGAATWRRVHATIEPRGYVPRFSRWE